MAQDAGWLVEEALEALGLLLHRDQTGLGRTNQKEADELLGRMAEDTVGTAGGRRTRPDLHSGQTTLVATNVVEEMLYVVETLLGTADEMLEGWELETTDGPGVWAETGSCCPHCRSRPLEGVFCFVFADKGMDQVVEVMEV